MMSFLKKTNQELSEKGKEASLKIKPNAFFEPKNSDLISGFAVTQISGGSYAGTLTGHDANTHLYGIDIKSISIPHLESAILVDKPAKPPPTMQTFCLFIKTKI